MQLRYDERLVEAAVLLCASGRRAHVPALQMRRFHHAREKCYSVLDPDDRNAAFYRLHLEWFREWGLENQLTASLADFPLFARSLSVLAFCQAVRKGEEGAELYVNDAGERNSVV